MIEVLKQQFSAGMTNEDKVNRVREFLQILALKILYDKGYFRHLAFVGGTALRLLFDLRRFSEDLDFSLIEKRGYDFNALAGQIENEFKLYGLNAEVGPKKDKTVQSAFLRFSRLLKELGLSLIDEQKLSIKLEVDTNPPKGWVLGSAIINKTYLLNVTSFDLPSLYATKLHACFFRKYVKGRDYYDLVWYIGRRVEPNYVLLNNAIEQTEGVKPGINRRNFKDFILTNIEKADFSSIKKDVERFLEDRGELKLLNLEAIKGSLA